MYMKYVFAKFTKKAVPNTHKVFAAGPSNHARR